MCEWRKRRVKQRGKQKGKTKAKKKRTCCQKCRRKIRNWLCKKIKRCVKKSVFGDPDPQLDDFEIAGINLGNVRDNLKRKNSLDSLKKGKENVVEKKPTVVTLFRNIRNKSTKSIPIKNAFVNELDRYSISKSIGNKVKSFIDDFRERSFFHGISKDSKLNLNKDEKENFRKLAQKYDRKSVIAKNLILSKSFDNFKRKFSLTASKSNLYRNMLNDLQKGNFNLTGLSSKQIRDINNINKQDLMKILSRYEYQKKKDQILDRKSEERKGFAKDIKSKYKDFSIKNLELIKNMDSDDLKKNFTLTGSKQKMLGFMIDDYKKGKFSLSAMRRDVKKDMKTLNKENLNKILDYYKHHNKSKRYSIVKQSKLKQLKSDLRARIGVL